MHKIPEVGGGEGCFLTVYLSRFPTVSITVHMSSKVQKQNGRNALQQKSSFSSSVLKLSFIAAKKMVYPTAGKVILHRLHLEV